MKKMLIFQKCALVMAVLAGMLVTLGPALPAHAGPFDAAKKQACRGADTGSGTRDCDNRADNKLSDTIQSIINVLTIIVGIAAVIAIILNGLRLILAAGDSNSITSARNGIIYALIGLIIVALAQAIVRFVLSRA